MLKNYFLFFSFLIGSLSVKAGGFLSVEFLRHYTPAELASLTFFSTTFDQGADAYKVTYATVGLNGEPAVVSGLLALPEDLTKRYPLACYQHGTSGAKDMVPSRLELDAVIPVSLAAKGYITVAPDLLGLGDHEGIHPYIHAASEAWVARDMMRAARQYAADNQVFINDQVFLTGYSQGGHSTLALHRMLEEELPGEFVVTASAPMSGPYSISQVMYNLIVSGSIYDKPGYLINTFISYQAVYGDVYADIASTFKAPYQPFIEAFANNEISLSQLDSALLVHLLLNEGMVVPVRVLKDDYVNAVMTQPDHPMRLAMEQNDVYDWAPLAPTRLMYCTADEEVPYENSTVAEAAMLANGAADVEAVVISPFLNHFLCALPAAVQTADFFSEYQLVEEVNLSAGRIPSGELLVCPNPLTGNRLTLKNIVAAGRLSIADMGGRVVFFHPVSEGNNLLWLPGLPAGVYSLKVVLPQYTRSQKLVVASR